MNTFAIRNMEHHERIFNYRLSRARRVVKNAFGILAHKFRVLLRTMNQRLAEKSPQVEQFIHYHNVSVSVFSLLTLICGNNYRIVLSCHGTDTAFEVK
jgi:hypothetical protein